jgi:hypothetical protein
MMSNTAHTREVTDLKNAGLNPILSANHSGASTPIMQAAAYSSPTTGAINGAQTAQNVHNSVRQQKNLDQGTVNDTDRTSQSMLSVMGTLAQIEANISKTEQEMDQSAQLFPDRQANLRMDTNQKASAIDLNSAHVGQINSQTDLNRQGYKWNEETWGLRKRGLDLNNAHLNSAITLNNANTGLANANTGLTNEKTLAESLVNVDKKDLADWINRNPGLRPMLDAISSGSHSANAASGVIKNLVSSVTDAIGSRIGWRNADTAAQNANTNQSSADLRWTEYLNRPPQPPRYPKR